LAVGVDSAFDEIAQSLKGSIPLVVKAWGAMGGF